jgi:hypothetical protein
VVALPHKYAVLSWVQAFCSAADVGAVLPVRALPDTRGTGDLPAWPIEDLHSAALLMEPTAGQPPPPHTGPPNSYHDLRHRDGPCWVGDACRCPCHEDARTYTPERIKFRAAPHDARPQSEMGEDSPRGTATRMSRKVAHHSNPSAVSRREAPRARWSRGIGQFGHGVAPRGNAAARPLVYRLRRIRSNLTEYADSGSSTVRWLLCECVSSPSLF